MKNKKTLKITAVVICVWLALGVIDLFSVAGGNKPILSFPFVTADDGGSGRYIGPGWAFDIEGNFMPEDKDYGVTSFDFYIFGIRIF